jgi:DNA-binding HxlR family transcriptional regulator
MATALGEMVIGNCDTRSCVSRQVLDRLASRWGLLIIRQLSTGTKRNTQLRHAIDGISEKMLAQTLRDLERLGLISRTSYPVVPPRVEYSLTSLGRQCAELIAPLLRFIEANVRSFYRESAVDSRQRSLESRVVE